MLSKFLKRNYNNLSNDLFGGAHRRLRFILMSEHLNPDWQKEGEDFANFESIRRLRLEYAYYTPQRVERKTSDLLEFLTKLSEGNSGEVIDSEPVFEDIGEYDIDDPENQINILIDGLLNKLNKKELVFLMQDITDLNTRKIFGHKFDLEKEYYDAIIESYARKSGITPETTLRRFFRLHSNRRGNAMYKNLNVAAAKEAIKISFDDPLMDIPALFLSLYSLSRDELRNFIKRKEDINEYYREMIKGKKDRYRKKWMIYAIFDHVYRILTGSYLFRRGDDLAQGRDTENERDAFVQSLVSYVENLNLFDKLEELKKIKQKTRKGKKKKGRKKQDDEDDDIPIKQIIEEVKLIMHQTDAEICYDYLLVEFSASGVAADEDPIDVLGGNYVNTYVTDLPEPLSITKYAGRPRDVAALFTRKVCKDKPELCVRRVRGGVESIGSHWYVITFVRLDPRNVYLMPRLTRTAAERAEIDAAYNYEHPSDELEIIFGKGRKKSGDCWFRYLVQKNPSRADDPGEPEPNKVTVVSFPVNVNEAVGARNDCDRYRLKGDIAKLKHAKEMVFRNEIRQMHERLADFFPIDRRRYPDGIPISKFRITKCVPKRLRARRIAPENQEDPDLYVDEDGPTPMLYPIGNVKTQAQELAAYVDKYDPSRTPRGPIQPSPDFPDIIDKPRPPRRRRPRPAPVAPVAPAAPAPGVAPAPEMEQQVDQFMNQVGIEELRRILGQPAEEVALAPGVAPVIQPLAVAEEQFPLPLGDLEPLPEAVAPGVALGNMGRFVDNLQPEDAQPPGWVLADPQQQDWGFAESPELGRLGAPGSPGPFGF